MDLALEVTLHIVNAIVGRAMPHVPELLDSKLIDIEKPGGSGLRPTAIRESWMGLAGLCTMAACPDAGRTLAPLQLRLEEVVVASSSAMQSALALQRT